LSVGLFVGGFGCGGLIGGIGFSVYLRSNRVGASFSLEILGSNLSLSFILFSPFLLEWIFGFFCCCFFFFFFFWMNQYYYNQTQPRTISPVKLDTPQPTGNNKNTTRAYTSSNKPARESSKETPHIKNLQLKQAKTQNPPRQTPTYLYSPQLSKLNR
jgi:hypothetical protein